MHSILNASVITAQISAGLAWSISEVLAVLLLVLLIQHEITNAGGARLAVFARHSFVAVVPLGMLFIVNVGPRLATALAH